jgi:pyruvate, water dikinase
MIDFNLGKKSIAFGRSQEVPMPEVADVPAASALHAVSPPDASWSSINLAEAVPGVMTPLCASVWVPASELGLRAPFAAMGVLPADQAGIPEDPRRHITGAFYGRMAVRVDFLCEMGDLIPGQSGEALSRDFFGFVPDDFVSQPSMRRLPWIVTRYPRTLLQIAGRIDRLRADTDAWWRTQISRIESLPGEQTRTLLTEAAGRFNETLAAQAVVSACAIQPLHEQLTNLAARAGVDATDLLRGHGSHEEARVLADLWAVSRDRLDMATFLRRHGYHCAGEGEVASVTWRENPALAHKFVAQYRTMDDTAAPNDDPAAQRRAGKPAEARFYAAFGRMERLKARLVLRLARRFVPLRGVGKVSYLQSLDVIRACARHLGEQLVAEGRLDDPDDAFYLTADELGRDLPSDLKTLVAQRRALRDEYQSLDAPLSWTGQPQPVVGTADDGGEVTTLAGVGASGGVVEGRAVVVDQPSDAEIDDGDVLVAHITDPSWVSLMFLASGLVVDIGGMMSHAAVVARELGIPCVMNTGRGTTALHTGDVIRIDGAAGTVEILQRIGVASP